MRSRCVALITRNPGLYADLAGTLRERRIPSVSLLPGQRIPSRVAVVLTSPQEAAEIAFPRVLAVAGKTDRTAIWAAVAGAIGGTTARELVVGIDPGPRPGYAVLSDEAPLAHGNLDTPEAVAPLGRELRRAFPEARLLFRVGSGDQNSRYRILNALWSLRRPVEIVDESGTTVRGRRRPRDAESAARIARTRGHRVRERTPLRITAGEVANLQRLSRLESGGRFTIPRSLALQVLEGKISLSDALREGERRYPSSPGRRDRPEPPSQELS